MQQKGKIVGALFFLLTIPALMLLYPYLNTSDCGVHSFVTSLDKSIPVIKIFVIPYTAWVGYIALTLIYICFKDYRLAIRTILVFDLGLIICFIIYYFFQTEGPVRPVITGQDVLSRMLQYIYSIDHPYNSFPSIHAMSSYLMIRSIRNCSWKNKWHQWIIRIFSTSIILATMFIKQHVMMDVIDAILLVECLFKSVEFVYGWLFLQGRALKNAVKKPSSYSA
ncbi:phosphatase PAP2 family protein [Bacillus sp. BRMEA1]|uniref:phosphatase PAP2 family protein n=1 Tax=Neobacillus endophyticus TaxID=2738405 RepID=UPI001564D541|nr:phosphatase PAP2 family protein [Neobacillus endophyticus]NRD78303.1 phosphatase PAP2 family protein [Neobacillus endophyticus]